MNRDWAWGLLIGGLAAASPHTGSARLIPSLVGGAFIGAIVWAIRHYGVGASWSVFASVRDGEPAEPLSIPLDRPSALGLLGALLVSAPTLLWLWGEYSTSIWRNGHGFFLPIVIYLLARSALRRERPVFRSDPWLALPFLVVAVVLQWLGANTGLGQIGAVGLMCMIPGASLLVLGAPATRCIAFPLLLLVFIMPFPEGLADPLALASSTTLVFEPFIQALGFPGTRVQTLYVMRDSVFGVATNCSGVSTFYAGFLLAIVLGRDLPIVPRLLLLLVVWPFTVAVNAVRVTLLVAGGAKWGPGFIHSPIHGLSGIATFWAVIALIAAAFFALRFATKSRAEEGRA